MNKNVYLPFIQFPLPDENDDFNCENPAKDEQNVKKQTLVK